MTTFGLDISHYQDLGLDLARCKREGVSFVFIKATEGAGVDAEFAANLAEARAAGLLVAAYHYQRTDVSAATQAAIITRTVPADVPLAIDVERNSGSVALTRDLISRLRQAGRRVALLYLPRWYWQQIGSPSLSGLPPLWSSRYPDTVVGSIADEWADVPASYWTGYGGLDVAVLQFTSSAAVAGYQPLDANAFRGTVTELAALLGGSMQEDDMDETQNALLNECAKRLRSIHTFGFKDVGDAPRSMQGDLAWFQEQSKVVLAPVQAMLATILANQANDVNDADVLTALRTQFDARIAEIGQQLRAEAEADRARQLEVLTGLVHEMVPAEFADAIVTELSHRLHPAA